MCLRKMCLMVWKRTFNGNVDLSTTCQCRQLKLNPLSTQINIYCLMTNQTPAFLVQRAPWTRAAVMLLQSLYFSWVTSVLELDIVTITQSILISNVFQLDQLLITSFKSTLCKLLIQGSNCLILTCAKLVYPFHYSQTMFQPKQKVGDIIIII